MFDKRVWNLTEYGTVAVTETVRYCLKLMESIPVINKLMGEHP